MNACISIQRDGIYPFSIKSCWKLMLSNMAVKALKDTFNHRASRFDKNTSATTINLSLCHDHHHILKEPRLKGAHQMTPPAKIAVTQQNGIDYTKDAFSQSLARCKFVVVLKLNSQHESILKVSVCSWAQINTGKWFHNKKLLPQTYS